MFFKLSSLQRFSLNCKLCIARFSMAFSRRIFRDQLSIVLRNRRNLLFAAASLVGVSFDSHSTLDEEECKHCDPFFPPEPDEGWELFWCNTKLAVYRRRLVANGGNCVYEYRCIGTYDDISPNDFVTVQEDITCRLQWDKNVNSLDVLDIDYNTGTQVIRYPYPLWPRLYIFARRQFVDRQGKQIVVLNRSLNKDKYPDPSRTTVRVDCYESTLIVRAHGKLDENGLDFVLSYHDDTKSPIPQKIYQYGVNVIGPSFLEEVHRAALTFAGAKKR
uniref:Phosphatidylcholine transfer protein n=1 Tax=Globodera pallida TaxID=36090 RepID=A0A183C4B9_GLOPA